MNIFDRYIQAILDKLIKVLLRHTGKGVRGNIYQTGEVNALLRIKKYFKWDKPIIFDVGGYKGDYVSVSDKLFSDSTIYTFEPIPALATILRETFNTSSTIHVQEIALSNTDGEQPIYFSKMNDGCSSLSERVAAGGTEALPIMVKVKTLDTFCEENNISHINVLKMDVEGGEFDILMGAKKILLNTDVIQFEFGCIYSRHFFQDFWVLLKEEFNFYRITPSGLRPITYYTNWLEMFVTSNYIAIKK